MKFNLIMGYFLSVPIAVMKYESRQTKLSKRTSPELLIPPTLRNKHCFENDDDEQLISQNI
jgi:hypothetical protein